MTSDDLGGGERFDVAYLVLSGTTTAARCPELLRGLVGLGFATVIALPTLNAARVIARTHRDFVRLSPHLQAAPAVASFCQRTKNDRGGITCAAAAGTGSV